MALARWFLTSRPLLQPRHDDTGAIAKCHYNVSVYHNNEWIHRSGRTHFPSILVDIFQLLLLSQQTAPAHQAVVELSFLWVTSQLCSYCGRKEQHEFFPFVNCRFCKERPARHHGRCCPARPWRGIPRETNTEYRNMCEADFVMDLLEATSAHDSLERLTHGYDSISTIASLLARPR